ALRAREHIVKRGSGRSVTNFGRVEISPGVSNIVPAETLLMQEMRELDSRVLARLDRECRALARQVARRRGCTLRLEPVTTSEAVRCAPRVMRAVEAACADLRLAFRRMPSEGGRSHRPDEQSDPRAIERGGNALLHTLLRLAEPPARAARRGA